MSNIKFYYHNQYLEDIAQDIVRDIPSCFHDIVRIIWEGELDNPTRDFNYTDDELTNIDLDLLRKSANKVRGALLEYNDLIKKRLETW